MSGIEDDIERRIARAVAGWQQGVTRPGAPLVIDEAWLQTPQALRLPFQVLKSAGVPPREIELLQQRARLRERLEQAAEGAERERLARQLCELEQNLALRLEQLRRLGQG